jgi:hypothetical protein
MHRRFIPVAVTGLMMAGAVTATAAESQEAREREARKACFTGNVERGVEILLDLYVETQHPNYIYNQARCFERNGKYDQALLSYEDYLRKATNLPDAERAQVEKSMVELRVRLTGAPSSAGAGRPSSSAPALLTPALDSRAVALGDTPADAPLQGPASDEAAAGRTWPWQRTAGVVSLIAAGGGLAMGVAGTVLRAGRAGDFNDVCTYYNGQPLARDPSSIVDFDCRGKYEAVKGAERMMWIGYVGGGVLAGAGVTLLLLAPRADKAGAMAWAGRCAPNFGTPGLVCGWRY